MKLLHLPLALLALALPACDAGSPAASDRSAAAHHGHGQGHDHHGNGHGHGHDDHGDDDEGCDEGGEPEPPGDVCGDVELHVIGLYDAYDSATDQYGVASVHIDRPGPVRLVLSSYSAATWNVTAGPDTELVEVVAHGHDAQAIVAPDGVPTATLGYAVDSEFLGCGYEYPDDEISGCETGEMLPLIADVMGQPVSSFHGCYAVSEFTVAADLTSTSNCATDKGYALTSAVFCGE